MRTLTIEALSMLSEQKVIGLANELGFKYRALRGNDLKGKARTLFSFICKENLKDKALAYLNKKSIAISYNSKIFDSCVSEYVNYLKEDYHIVFDKDKEYGISKTNRIISDFERILADQDYFIAFINKPFTQSFHCMHELCYFFAQYDDEEIKKRFIPVFFDDFIFNDDNLKKIKELWKTKLIRYINKNDMTPETRSHIDIYTLICCNCFSNLLKIKDISSVVIHNDIVEDDQLFVLKRLLKEKQDL